MVLHIDMDAFYASVEERDHPEYQTKPLIIGGSADGRGVVSTANYIARKYGVHSAMPAATAKKLCPNAVFLYPRIDYYATISRQIREIFKRYTPVIEPLSLDEAFLDVEGSTALFGSEETIGKRIQDEIQNELKLTASVGVAPNKFLAKIASDLDKPNGFVVVPQNDIQSILDPLPVSRIWGVGKVGNQKLLKLGIRTFENLRKSPLEILKIQFGNHAETLWKLSQGIDSRKVVPDHEAKSISHEMTFSKDIKEMEILRSCLMDLTEQVGRRLRRHHYFGKTISLKIRYDDFQTFTRSCTIDESTNTTQVIWFHAENLLKNRLPDRTLSIRLIGVSVTGLSHSKEVQKTLFDLEEELKPETNNSIDQLTDQIRDQFGSAAISRGISMNALSKNRKQLADPPPDELRDRD